MESWQILTGLVVSAVVGGFVKEKFFSAPASITAKVANLEREVAVIQATKLTEPQVRTIVHEQLQPLMLSVNGMITEQKRQADMLARIEERLANQEKQ